MSTPTGLRPGPGERARRAPCGCLETDSRVLELCDGCLAEWTRMHEEARTAIAAARAQYPRLCDHPKKPENAS